MYDAVTGELKLTLGGSDSNVLKGAAAGHQGSVLHVEYSPDGKWIVTASEDGTARVWDAATGAQNIILEGHTSTVHDANFNPDSTRIVTASDDRTARVWNVADGKELFQLRGHTGPVNAAAYSHDGKFIVTASSDKTARIWDAATGNEIAILRGHTDKVQSAEYSPDDQHILTASSDRTARITLANIARILELAKQYATRALSCDEWQTLLGEANFCPGGGVTQSVNAYPTLAPITRVAVAPQTPNVANTVSTTKVPATSEPTAPVTPTENSSEPTPTTDILSQPSGGGGGATQTPTVEPTAQAQPTIPPATPTPQLAPGVYVSKIVFAPLNPGQSPASGEFHVTFLNNTGTEQGFTRWKALIFRPGDSKSIGDTSGLERTIPPGTFQAVTAPYNLGVAQCEQLIAALVSENNDRVQTPLVKTDGTAANLEFQMCP